MHPSPDVLALLALGEEAGTPAEREHVTSCTQCETEVNDMARAVAVGREGQAGDGVLTAPPDRVWTAIRAELGFGPPPVELDGAAYGAHGRPEISDVTAPPRHAQVETNGSGPHHPAEVIDLGQARAGRSSRGRRFLAVAVAAALALVVGVGLGFGLNRVLAPQQKVLWTAELQAEAGFPGSRGTATVLEQADGSRILRVQLATPAPVDGSREVWLIDRNDSRLRPIGWITGEVGQWPIPGDVDPRQLPVVDVSREPPGDNDPNHSKVSIVRGTLDV